MGGGEGWRRVESVGRCSRIVVHFQLAGCRKKVESDNSDETSRAAEIGPSLVVENMWEGSSAACILLQANYAERSRSQYGHHCSFPVLFGNQATVHSEGKAQNHTGWYGLLSKIQN